MSVVSNLEKGLMKLSDVNYNSIDKLMRRLAKDHDITPRELHDRFKAKHKMIPDDWAKKKMKINEEGLRDWFGKSKSKDGKPGWVQSDGSPCANEPGETKTPKCYSSAKKASMSKKELRSADARKSRKDPGQQQKSGAAKPTYVKTDSPRKMKKEEVQVTEAADKKGKGSGTKDACYHKVKSRYSVWPSAYASGALVKCRKVGAANWGNSTKKEGMEEFYNLPELTEAQIGALKYAGYDVEVIDEKCWAGYEKKGMKTMFGKRYPNCVKKEETEVEKMDEGKYSAPGEMYVKGSAPVTATYDGKTEKFTKEKYIKKSAKQVKESHKNPESVKGIAKELDKAVEMHKSQAKRLRKSGVSEAMVDGPRKDAMRKKEFSAKTSLDRGNAFNIGSRRDVSNSDPMIKSRGGRSDKRTGEGDRGMGNAAKRRMGEEYDTTEWKDNYKPTEIETTDLIKPEPIKGGQLHEVERTKMQAGNLYQVIFGWRGKMMMVKLFFPNAAVPNRQKVASSLDKMYPGAQLRSYSHSVVDYDDPYINVGTNEETIHEGKGEEKYCRLCEKRETRDECSYGPSMFDKYSVENVSDFVKDTASSDSDMTEDINKEVESRMQSDENRKRTQMRNKHRASRLKQNKVLHSEHSNWRQAMQEDMEGMSQKSGDKRPTDKGAGMTAQGVAKYNRRTGGNLKTAVTTPPSKLKPGSKAAKRRKSFCARSRSWTGERGKAARRRWNC
jgi:hypothetical protein